MDGVLCTAEILYFLWVEVHLSVAGEKNVIPLSLLLIRRPTWYTMSTSSLSKLGFV
jgi:hypothetical protein